MSSLIEKGNWRVAYKADVADLQSMSLVHPTWALIARQALQRRVVAPCHQINAFLSSPLCGPRVQDMVVCWTFDNGLEGATDSHLDLLEALLGRTIHLRSLAFVTFLGWPSDENSSNPPPPFRVSVCLKVISSMLPNLNNLWLKHFAITFRYIERYSSRFHGYERIELSARLQRNGHFVPRAP